MAPIDKRYDFVLLYDVSHGNPNGDPDAGNAPRIDPETGHGLVSDVALKRKVRDFVTLAKTPPGGDPEPGYDIYIKHRSVLQNAHERAYEALDLDDAGLKGAEKADAVDRARAWMCQTFYDVRTFGAVMSLKTHNCGQVRGPAQITFSRSIDPIASLDQSIVRKAVATRDEGEKQINNHGQITGTMGRKQLVPYGLYRAHGFLSPHLAHQTGFDGDDLDLLWRALEEMFDHDHTATRGEMATRKLLVFEHESALGNARSHDLFDRVKVEAANGDAAPARSWSDYRVTVEQEDLPRGVTLHERV